MDLQTLIEAWDEAYREFAIALDRFPPADLWKRPHPSLLSVGELAGHVAYWQTVYAFGGGEDQPKLETLSVKSVLVDHRFRYYSQQVGDPVVMGVGPEEVRSELARLFEAAKEAVRARTADDPAPGQWGTWGNLVQYQVFHVAYHTGQAYSVRHLLGHETEDN